MLEIVSQHVTADLSQWVQDDQVLLTYFINPDGNGSFAGSICAMGPDTWGRDSKEWAVHLAFRPGDPAAYDREGLLARVRRLLGVEDLEVEVHSISHWEFEGVVAERFRSGPFLLVGNAAHRHPPTGGLGLNCAVQDVHNLVWKLDAVLSGYAHDALLDTYQTERKPIAEWYVEHSLANVGGHARVAAALGLRPGQSEAEGWREIAVWAGDGEDAERRRAEVAEAVASNLDDYSQLNVEAGYSYETGAVVPDGTPPPATHGSLREFTATTRPGHHLPHVWLRDEVSTIDAIARRGFTLFVAEAGAEPWRDAAGRCAAPIHVVSVGEWHDAWETTDTGAVLVRPDSFVAWRSIELPDDPETALHQAVAAICAGGPDSAANTLDQEAMANR
jgi:2,4-dichlorophenol 6-monooxygenase